MKIVLIAALAENGTIGDRGTIPWHISDDLKRFKSVTLGHPIIMGRKTFDSLGKPLPGRTNIVLTRNPDFHPPEGVSRLPGTRSRRLAHCRTIPDGKNLHWSSVGRKFTGKRCRWLTHYS